MGELAPRRVDSEYGNAASSYRPSQRPERRGRYRLQDLFRERQSVAGIPDEDISWSSDEYYASETSLVEVQEWADSDGRPYELFVETPDRTSLIRLAGIDPTEA